MLQTACQMSQVEGVVCDDMLVQGDDKPGANQKATAAVRSKFSNKGYPAPEKVLTLDPKIARTHTTFYAQADGDDKPGANQKATAAVRKGFNNKGYPAPEKVLTLDPKIARTHTTFYAQADGDDKPGAN